MKPYIIGIVGGSGSGKTTFVKKLKEEFEDKDLCIISSDDYYVPRAQQKIDSNGIRNFDLPESIDGDALAADLKKLMSGELVQKEEYTFNNELNEAKIIEYKPAKVYVIEGLFIYHYAVLKEVFNLKIFIQAKENIKVIRRIKRDRIERNYDLEDVLYRYENHVLPSYEKYIKPYAADADLIINNNQSFDEAYQLISNHIHVKLDQ